jgi:nucleotide-binding universal stress UspA family protein
MMADGPTPRRFLVIADGSPEAPAAALFAGYRAKATGGQVVILRVVEPADFSGWLGIGVAMRDEAMAAGQTNAVALARLVEAEVGVMPEVRVREGKVRDTLAAEIARDPAIKVLVLAAGSGRAGPGPLVTSIASGKAFSPRPVAVTIVPGELDPEALRDLG